MRGSVIVARYSRVPSVDPLSQMTISRVASDARKSTFSTHWRSRWTRLKVRTAIAIEASADAGSADSMPDSVGQRRGPRDQHSARFGGVPTRSVGVVIRTLNEAEHMAQCLETLRGQRGDHEL